jgi:hypothetical protein
MLLLPQGYVYFRHGDKVTYQHLTAAAGSSNGSSSNGSSSNGYSSGSSNNSSGTRDIGAALCHCVAAAVESYGLSPSYEDSVRLNWEGAKLQKQVSHTTISHFDMLSLHKHFLL